MYNTHYSDQAIHKTFRSNMKLKYLPKSSCVLAVLGRGPLWFDSRERTQPVNDVMAAGITRSNQIELSRYRAGLAGMKQI